MARPTLDVSSYLEPVAGPIRFISEQITLPDGRLAGVAQKGDEWIRDSILTPIFERDGSAPRYRLVYAELPRGHWKSGGAAAVAVTEAILHESTDCVIAAADTDQARIILDNISGYLARNPSLRRAFKVTKDLYTCPVTDSRIRVISSDAPTSWGLGGTHKRFRLIADELTMWRSEDLWVSLASATGKTKDAMTLVLSNAGYDPEGSWQWRVREIAEKEDWGWLFSTDGPVASWISDSWIEEMRMLLPRPAFERAILNKWISELGDFISKEQWRRCIDERWNPQVRGVAGYRYFAGWDLGLSKVAGYRYFAGWDLGLSKDRCCLTVMHADDERRICLDDLMIWQGRKGAEVDIANVERVILDLSRRFHPFKLIVDPWQTKSSIQRLRREGVSVSEYPFSASSVQRLSSILYNIVASADLRVYEDRELEREMLGLRTVSTSSGWKVDHARGGFSDRAISIGLAAQAALESLKAPVPVLSLADANSGFSQQSNFGGFDWESQPSTRSTPRELQPDRHGPLGSRY